MVSMDEINRTMNNKGQIGSLGVAVIVAVMLFIAGMLAVNFVRDSITDTRTQLTCSTPGISDGTKLACLLVDIVVPYFIVIIISAAGGLITYRFTL
jgi:hypothetical protein